MIRLLEVVEEQRAIITPTVEWVPRGQWVIHLCEWRARNPGMSN